MSIENISNKYPKEHNQCLILALTEVSILDYETIHLFVQHTMNRTKNNTVQFSDIQNNKKMFKNIGLRYKSMKVDIGETISSFIEGKGKEGSYLLFSENHVSALINGVLKDVVDDVMELDQELLNIVKVN